VLRNHIGLPALLAFAVLAMLATACSKKDAGAGKTATKPNILLIVPDALRADRLGAERNGVPIMPNLAALAKESILFSNASAPCTWTRPSMASLFTSLSVDTHQVYFSGGDPRKRELDESDALSESLETMASYLKKAGYMTAGIVTNANLLASLGFSQGFDRYEYLKHGEGEFLTARAREETEKLTEPFFFYVHYMDTHMPYLPPEEYRELLGWPPPIDKAELATVLDFMDYGFKWNDFKMGLIPEGPEPLSEAAREALRTLYDGDARHFDDHIIKLIDYVQKSYPNTYIVLLSDHGEHFWEHGYLGHGLTLYEVELRVPFLIWGPGIDPGVVSRAVSTLDLLPTLADLLDLEPNPAWQGSSLFSISEDMPEKAVYSHTRGTMSAHNRDFEMAKRHGLTLIWNHIHDKMELHDLENDPKEQYSLVEQLPDIVSKLKGLLEAHHERTVRARQKNGGEKVQLDSETLRQLEALGYR